MLNQYLSVLDHCIINVTSRVISSTPVNKCFYVFEPKTPRIKDLSNRRFPSCSRTPLSGIQGSWVTKVALLPSFIISVVGWNNFSKTSVVGIIFGLNFVRFWQAESNNILILPRNFLRTRYSDHQLRWVHFRVLIISASILESRQA